MHRFTVTYSAGFAHPEETLMLQQHMLPGMRVINVAVRAYQDDVRRRAATRKPFIQVRICCIGVFQVIPLQHSTHSRSVSAMIT